MKGRLAGLLAGAVLVGAGAQGVLAQTPAPTAASASSRPNIILITAEDMSPRVGAFGDPVARTPNLDALAREGVRYTHVFATAAVCAPSRSALITGVHQQTLGTMHMRTSSFGKDMDHGAPYQAVPPARIKAFPELLRAAGYCAINNPKTDYQFGEPFTVWDESGAQADWSHCAAGQPVFAMINHGQTHESLTWPPETRGRHPSIPDVVRRSARLDAQKPADLTNPAVVRVPAYWPDTPVVRTNIARFYDNIRVMDAEAGELLERLKKEGRFEDSVIIFLTDHGDGLPRGKRSLYDSGLRTPMIVRYPDGRGAGTINQDMISFIDIAPTILAIAGVEAPDWIQGRDILRQNAPQEYVFSAGDRFDEVTQRRKSVRDARFRYTRNYIPDQSNLPVLVYQDVNPIMREWRRLYAEGGLTPLQRAYLEPTSPAEELYDTQADPDEVRNLAQDPAYAEELVRLRGALDAWIEQVGDLSAVPETDMAAAMWPGGVQPETAAPVACRIDGGVRLLAATDGASVGWRAGDGAWRLYTGPVEAATFEVKAIRYGYKESPAVVVEASAISPC